MNMLKRQETVDELVLQLRRKGFMTISRRFGKYLPDPKPIGKYQIDAVGRYKKDYAIGLNLTEDDFESVEIREKITFLANRHTKSSNKNVLLYLGVPSKFLTRAKSIVSDLDLFLQKNIRIIPLTISKLN
ncbi:MAG: hypothetical protein K9J12_11820 [Melioribacteraceae bacterium]|nr:hypothetical protein [Melioribacteraceae bacterium]MCF8264059.1 hypothetical protein [Melioribacteraceae bacterium]MCF8411871.1 hypothetical protein [Melioribacteraceae bacterium]MCF8432235.1 hypothetical protein [Melioribacteraceae bacterium]